MEVHLRVLLNKRMVRHEQFQYLGFPLLHQVHEGTVVEATVTVLTLERVKLEVGEKHANLVDVAHVPVLVLDGNVDAIAQLHKGGVFRGEGQAHFGDLRRAACFVQQLHDICVTTAERVHECRVPVVILCVTVGASREQHLQTMHKGFL